jgi:hypothetical protein
MTVDKGPMTHQTFKGWVYVGTSEKSLSSGALLTVA